MQIKGGAVQAARITAAMLVCAFALTIASPAQNENGSISGYVFDSQQKTVPNVTVTATDVTKQFVSTAKTDQQGRYTFPDLNPGAYVIGVEAPGFKKYTQENVILHANEKASLPDIVLAVGPVTESVTVTAQAAQLKTEGAELSDTVESKEINNIAINGRNPLALISLLPGVSGVVEEPIAGTGGIQNFSANGTRNNSNNLTI